MEFRYLDDFYCLNKVKNLQRSLPIEAQLILNKILNENGILLNKWYIKLLSGADLLSWGTFWTGFCAYIVPDKLYDKISHTPFWGW